MRLISHRVASVFALLLLLFPIAAGQAPSSNEAVRLLPKTVGDFRSQGARPGVSSPARSKDFRIRDAAVSTYVSPKGERLVVSVVRTQSQSSAYALLSEASALMRAQGKVTKTRDVGIAGLSSSNKLVFYKGTAFVSISGPNVKGDSMLSFARVLAGTLEDIENEIPVLVKHLPEWESAQDRARYAISLRTLQEVVGNQPSLDVVGFDEGAEAVTSDYGALRLVIVEFSTPQVAAINDERIAEKIRQLNESGQPAPTAYRRVGNYSVFVFNAPDQVAASQLIDAVKYEQRVQWLGQNPFAFEEAERQFTVKTVSLILSIAKAIGFFVGLCLGAGGIVGGIAFLHRRSQQKASAESYSDAGGMLRLNLDDMTGEADPPRLLTGEDGKDAVSP